MAQMIINSRDYSKIRKVLRRESIPTGSGVLYDSTEINYTIDSRDIQQMTDIVFVKINGIDNKWKSDQGRAFNSYLGDILAGLNKYNSVFVYAIFCYSKKLYVYIGTQKKDINYLCSSLKGYFPAIRIEQNDNIASEYKWNVEALSKIGGVILGYPHDKTTGSSFSEQMERLITGSMGMNWGYVVVAQSVARGTITKYLDSSLRKLGEYSEASEESVSRQETSSKQEGGTTTNINTSTGSYSTTGTNTATTATTTEGTSTSKQITKKDYSALELIQSLEEFNGKLCAALNRGAWIVNPYYFAADPVTANAIGKNLKSIFSGGSIRLESVKNIGITNISMVVSKPSIIRKSLPAEIAKLHPCIEMYSSSDSNEIIYQFASLVSSDDLAVFAQIIKKEYQGYFVDTYVPFEIDMRRPRSSRDLKIAEIYDGSDAIGSQYLIDINELNRHGLIIGITGGGKSNTAKSILYGLYDKHIPFLVIESAKKEYWEISNYGNGQLGSEMRFFTFGVEDTKGVPFRINPFEKPQHIPLQTHIDNVFATFKASFELEDPLPYIIERAIYDIYKDKGFSLTDEAVNSNITDFPTIDDLYYKIEVVVSQLNYEQRVYNNIKSALQVRIGSLRVGGKGAMLNVKHSMPIESLLSVPTVIELDAIADDEIKAFVMGILLISIYEYRMDSVSTNSLKHVILIEEAHRLLKAIDSGSSRSQRKAVSFFCDMLAEVRSYGQGFLIADQIPSKLASDIIKNTNLKIVHRTVAQQDRELIGNTMNMTDSQISFLSTLKKGFAAIYSEGDVHPKLVKFPFVGEQQAIYTRDSLIIKKRLTTIVPKQITYDRERCYLCKKCTQQEWHISELTPNGLKNDFLLYLFKSKWKNDKQRVLALQECRQQYFSEKKWLSLDAYDEKIMLEFIQDRLRKIVSSTPKDKCCVLGEVIAGLRLSESCKHELFNRLLIKTIPRR